MNQKKNIKDKKNESALSSPKVINAKKDKFLAKISFYLSLGFWIPLFNIGLCITSLIVAISALKLYLKDKNHYGGLNYILAAMVISITTIILTIVFMLIYLASERLCASATCAAILASN